MTSPSSSSTLLWPPPTCEEKYDGQRVDLLALIPPNCFDDLNLPNREQQVAGLTLRADRVIMDRHRYPDCERMTQHKLSDDIQASCREQGHVISVKEWADKNQHRGTLRLRLRCRSSACRFQFQLNWDSKSGFWYISRRRCGTFVHTCQPLQGGGNAQTSAAANKRRLTDNKGASNKRAKIQPQQEGTDKNTTERKPSSSSNADSGNKAQQPESAVLDALDSARSLLDLSRAPSSPVPVSPTNEENQKPQEESPVSVAPASFAPVRLGDRLFIPQATSANLSTLLASTGPTAAALTAQQKLAIFRGQQQQQQQNANNNALASTLGRMDAAAFKAALVQQRCMALAPPPGGQALLQDPRLIRTGLLLNGGAFANI